MGRLMPWLGWVANVFLVIGLWTMGDRWPYAFAFTFVGEALWSIKVAKMRQWDMLAICVVFAILALRNLVLWSS